MRIFGEICRFRRVNKIQSKVFERVLKSDKRRWFMGDLRIFPGFGSIFKIFYAHTAI